MLCAARPMSWLDSISRALEARGELLRALADEHTDCVRLFHGAVEGRPGLAIDRYGPVLLIQTWGEPLEPADDETIAARVRTATGLDLTPCWNHRGPERGDGLIGSANPESLHPIGTELGARFDVRPRHRGPDPLLFLDLRAGRRWIRANAGGRSVLNLFSYTCGVGIAAALGGAREVWNVDFSESALQVGHRNAELNGIERNGSGVGNFRTLQEDVIPMVRQLAGLPMKGRGAKRTYTKHGARSFDIVVLDPPRFARTPFGAVDVARDYPSLFKPALLISKPGGTVLATNHVPEISVEEWSQILSRTAEKTGRSISIEWMVPEADFPSPDQRSPLKIALVRVA